MWTALAVASLPAQARAECTFQFGGTVTELRFDFGNPPYDVREGDVWSIIYEFDTTAAGDIICPVFDTNGGAVGFYQAITSYTFTIQAPTGLIIHTETQTCSPGFCGTIDVFDNRPAGFDQYEVFVQLEDFSTWFMELDTFPTGDSFNNTTCPTTDTGGPLPNVTLPIGGDIDLAEFTVKQFRIFAGDDFEILGTVDSHASSCFLAVAIDIKPGSDPNSINLGSKGTVPVAIFSAPTFDATRLDPLTVTLADAEVKVRGKGTPSSSIQDVDGDGLLDIVVHVETAQLQLSETDTEAVLNGTTFDGLAVQGTGGHYKRCVKVIRRRPSISSRL